MRPRGEPDLSIDLAGLHLDNPVMAASGTFGYGEEYASVVDLNRLGAVVVKGLSLKAREGHPPPRLHETPSGMINAIGLENVGLQAFLQDKLPFLRKFKTKIIVNIWGETVDEYCELARQLSEAPGIHGLEVNISCPNVKKGGMAFGSDPKSTFELLAAVREVTQTTLIAKLSPNVADISEIALAAKSASVDIVSLVNTFLAMSIDIEKQRPALSAMTGGLSGPAIRPIALRMVWEVARTVQLPIIAMGGIIHAEDAIEYFLAGASAVAIGTGNFQNPYATLEAIEGIRAYLVRKGHTGLRQIIGAAHRA